MYVCVCVCLCVCVCVCVCVFVHPHIHTRQLEWVRHTGHFLGRDVSARSLFLCALEEEEGVERLPALNFVLRKLDKVV